ncbi:hypothetical protein Daus18300_011446 [Diaporthe australafricana]|uniref:Acyl-CoA thioesterase II n=1 Tax=Diaporthe australafricana TaxID=127596 RepID=A0ABR3W6F7_9PEZI
MAETLKEQLAVHEIAPSEFLSQSPPGRMGNSLPIAYGDCTMGVAAAAACATVPASYYLFSLVGHYLGPGRPDMRMRCTVNSTRTTKILATRRVEVKQTSPDGTSRVCMELIADFHIEEPAAFIYSAPPRRKYSGPEVIPDLENLSKTLLSNGRISQRQAEMASATGMFGLMGKFFETRHPIEGVAGQNMFGIAKHIPTDQDSLHITDKTSAEWIKTLAPLETRAEKMSALAFELDDALSFTPMAHSGLWFEDVGVASTLDFAMRLFVPDVDLSHWHLRERNTLAAAVGRQYSESRMWDQERALVASMTQQSILRSKSKLLKSSI